MGMMAMATSTAISKPGGRRCSIMRYLYVRPASCPRFSHESAVLTFILVVRYFSIPGSPLQHAMSEKRPDMKIENAFSMHSRRLFSSMQRDRYYQPDRSYPICLSRRAVDLVISYPVVTVTRTIPRCFELHCLRSAGGQRNPTLISLPV